MPAGVGLEVLLVWQGVQHPPARDEFLDLSILCPDNASAGPEPEPVILRTLGGVIAPVELDLYPPVLRAEVELHRLAVAVILRLSQVDPHMRVIQLLVKEIHVDIKSCSIQSPGTSVEILLGTLVNIRTADMRVSSEARLAGAVVGAVPVPAVGVLLTEVAALRALVDVPASHPGGVLGEPRHTGTAEAAHAVGAGGLNATVSRPIEVGVVRVTLVRLQTGGLVQVCVTVVTGSAVLVIAAAHLPMAADSVQLVAVSVAAVVRGAEAEPSGVVGVLREGEVLRVETEIVATPRPARPVTVLVTEPK